MSNEQESATAREIQSAQPAQEPESWERDDVEAVAACLGDDAAQLRETNEEDERADNMDRAASMLTWMLLTHPVYAAAPAATQPARDGMLGSPIADHGAPTLEWAVQQWRDEVQHRPLENVHRRFLDAHWRSLIRRCHGDPDELVGPDHDALRGYAPMPMHKASPGPDPAATQPEGQEAREAFELWYADHWKKATHKIETVAELAAVLVTMRDGNQYHDGDGGAVPYIDALWESWQAASSSQAGGGNHG